MSEDFASPVAIRLPHTLRQQAEVAARTQGISLHAFILRTLTEHMEKIAGKHKTSDPPQT